jgi:hypothetical protein
VAGEERRRFERLRVRPDRVRLEAVAHRDRAVGRLALVGAAGDPVGGSGVKFKRPTGRAPNGPLPDVSPIAKPASRGQGRVTVSVNVRERS